MKPSQKSFTLLELLVVITIIGILASIVVVSMSGSTDSADIAQILSFSHQVHALLGHEAVLDLNFNENTTDTCPNGKDVCDASGYNNNGEISGATYISSPIDGYALSFNGSSDYVDCGNNLDLNAPTEVTAEAWVLFNTTSITMSLISKRASWSTPSGYSLMFDYTTVNGIEMRGRQYNYARANDAGLETGKWYYIVGILNDDGSKNKVYINGIDKTTNISKVETLENNTDNVYIGSRPGLTGFFNGFLDEVRIYAEALSLAEIQKHYAFGLKRLLANQFITQAEYIQRIGEFEQFLVNK